jgi:ribonuclease D
MIWIDQQTELDQHLERISGQQPIAIDTEADSFHSYYDKVCLIQLTANGEDVLIDPLAGLDLDALGRILAERETLKILHGADYDLRILGRDYDFQINNLVDTMICAQLLGEPAIGLAALLKKYLDVELDKSHQRADWARRPLPRPMLEYAAEDTRHLARLASMLRSQLESLGRWEWAREEFERMESIRWNPPEGSGEGWRKLKGASRLDPRGSEILRRLFEWRDGEARSRDVPPFRILANETMLAIARERPRGYGKLGEIKGVSPGGLRRYGNSLLEAVHGALSMPEEELPRRGEAKKWKPDRELDRVVNRLKKVRDEVAQELGIDSSVLAPKHVLTAVAQAKPRTVDELSSIEPLRRWQIEQLGERLLKAVHGS